MGNFCVIFWKKIYVTATKFACVRGFIFMVWQEVGEAAQICQFIKNEVSVNVNEFCVNEAPTTIVSQLGQA